MRTCSATRSITGTYGTALISQVSAACTFAAVLSPRLFAAVHSSFAASLGPGAESEYSLIVDFTPPRSVGTPRSLTVITRHPAGRCATIFVLSCIGQPQSQHTTSASGFPAFTPSLIVRLTSATMSATVRSLQRGHVSFPQRDAQLVRFSLIVIVNTPPRPGTCANTDFSASRSQRRVSGHDVQRAYPRPSCVRFAPRASIRPGFSKKESFCARGSFMYRYTFTPYFAARATSFFRFAMRLSLPSPNSGYFGSRASVESTVCSHTALTPFAASRASRPSGYEPISSSPSGSP